MNEDFESGTLGLFSSSGTPGWITTTTNTHTGSYAAFAPDLGRVTDLRLTLSTPFAMPPHASQATLNFYQRYDFEGNANGTAYDGGLLEASTDGGASWGNPFILSGRYNAVLYDCPSQNPLAGQAVWSGNSGGWQQVVADVTPYLNRNLLFRFRLATDQTGGAGGWWIDDISIVVTNQVCNSPTPTGTITSTRTPTRTATITSTGTVTSTATPCAVNLSDVHPTDYFYNGVRWLYCRGAISGYIDGTFRPSNLATRAQVCKIVVLTLGVSIYTPPSQTFRDVPESHPFFVYIETAYHVEVISGYSCGSNCLEFRPYNNITRAQVAKVFVLMKGWPLLHLQVAHFRDVPTTNTFFDYIETAYCHQVISGYGCGTGCLEFHPDGDATRGQIAKMLYNAVLNLPCAPPPGDDK